MKIMAESRNYQIVNSYETVYLKRKGTDQKIIIGDFYGDPELAVISPDERYCVMAGAGIIIYYLKKPFTQYRYNVQNSPQWKEWGREDAENTIYVPNVSLLDDDRIEVETEEGEKVILNIY